jgi:pilus assembly protein Flp/PilA
MLKSLQSLVRNEEGATAIEYGLIAALIAVAIVGTLALIGPKLDSTFQTVNDNLPEAAAE